MRLFALDDGRALEGDPINLNSADLTDDGADFCVRIATWEVE